MRTARISSQGRLSPAQWLLSFHLQGIRAYAGIFMVLVVLLLSAASSSPQLHNWLHGHQTECCDSNNTCDSQPEKYPAPKSHSCAVVMLATGLTPLVVDIPVPAPACSVADRCDAYTAPLVGSLRTTHSARAPPARV